MVVSSEIEVLGGYCSSVHGTEDGELLFATGRVGTYYSITKGESWEMYCKDTFYSVKVNKNKLYFSARDRRLQVVHFEGFKSKL